MCYEAARHIALHQLREDRSQPKIRLVFPEGLPNFMPADSIRITEPAPTLVPREEDLDQVGSGSFASV